MHLLTKYPERTYIESFLNLKHKNHTVNTNRTIHYIYIYICIIISHFN